jgi:hypothetical protein
MMKSSRVLGRRLIEQSFSYQITVDDTAEESKNCGLTISPKKSGKLMGDGNNRNYETETILLGETYF